MNKIILRFVQRWAQSRGLRPSFFAVTIKRATAAPNLGRRSGRNTPRSGRPPHPPPPEGDGRGEKKEPPGRSRATQGSLRHPIRHQNSTARPGCQAPKCGGRSRRQKPAGGERHPSAANERSESRAAPAGGSRSGDRAAGGHRPGGRKERGRRRRRRRRRREPPRKPTTQATQREGAERKGPERAATAAEAKRRSRARRRAAQAERRAAGGPTRPAEAGEQRRSRRSGGVREQGAGRSRAGEPGRRTGASEHTA